MKRSGKVVSKKREEEIVAYVRSIFDMRNSGMTLQQIGDAIGKTREYVRQVLNGIMYTDIKNRYHLEFDPIAAKLAPLKLTKEKVSVMFEMIDNGAGSKEVADYLDKTETVIFRLLKNSTKLFKKMGYDSIAAKEQVIRNNKTFSDEDIIMIFKMYGEGKSQSEIAEHFDSKQTTISSVLIGQNYKKDIEKLGLKPITLKLTEEAIIAIFELYNQGRTLTEIAYAYKVTPGHITNLLNGNYPTFNKIIEKHQLKKTEGRVFGYWKRILSDEQVKEVFRLRNDEKLTVEKISQVMDVSYEVIRDLLRGESYKDIIEKYRLTCDLMEKRLFEKTSKV